MARRRWLAGNRRVAQVAVQHEFRRRQKIQAPRPGLHQPRLGHEGARHLQRRLHRQRLQARPLLEQHRRGAADECSRHAGPGSPDVRIRPVAGDMLIRKIHREQAPGRLSRRHPPSGRHQVGLHHQVVLRRTARTERRHLIVVARGRALRVERANRRGVRRIAGRRDAAQDACSVRLLSEIPRGGDDEYPGAHRTLHRRAYRIVAIRLIHRPAERQVDDADVVLLLVLNRPVDGLDDIARRARTVVAEHAQV